MTPILARTRVLDKIAVERQEGARAPRLKRPGTLGSVIRTIEKRSLLSLATELEAPGATFVGRSRSVESHGIWMQILDTEACWQKDLVFFPFEALTRTDFDTAYLAALGRASVCAGSAGKAHGRDLSKGAGCRRK